MTTEFGFTAWGADIVRIAEPIEASTPNTSAPRARSIARNGGVTVNVDGRQVTAHVHRGGSASIAHLEIAAMDASVMAALREEIGTRTEPDDAVHAALRARGLRPQTTLEAADCSCSARARMCVHVLAALYAFAAVVDHSPATLIGMQSGDATPDNAAPDAPAPRWTPVAALDVRDYFSVRAGRGRRTVD